MRLDVNWYTSVFVGGFEPTLHNFYTVSRSLMVPTFSVRVGQRTLDASSASVL
jgi:hypothetical protein